MNHAVTEKYMELIARFVAGQITVLDFERLYLEMFKAETQSLSTDDYEILDALFADVDAFCNEPELRGPNDLNEQQLREKCAGALAALTVNRKVPA
jgi:hypothetical protein